MTEILSWNVHHCVQGPLLQAAIDEMNGLGPFKVDDDVVRHAPRYAELVGGLFRMTTPASGYHGGIVGELCGVLRSLVGERGLVVVHAPVRTCEGRTVREADVAVYLGRTLAEFGDTTYPRFSPDLIVGVLSESAKAEDRGAKKAEYEDVGVREGEREAFGLREQRYERIECGQGGFSSNILGQAWDTARVVPKSE